MSFDSLGLFKAKAALTHACWANGKTFTYFACCRCGNGYGNFSGDRICWTNEFSFADCCSWYGKAEALSELPCWQDARGLKYEMNLSLGKKTWQVLQWPKETYDVDAVMPYVVWPSSYILAAWLHDIDPLLLARKRSVEFGCGIGLPSIAAASLGMRALATDIDPLAVALTAGTAGRNLDAAATGRLQVKTVDFTDGEELEALGKFDLILIAGQFYKESLTERLVTAILSVCASGCDILLAFQGGRQERVTDFSLFLWQHESLHVFKEKFVVRESFLCANRGYVTPWSSFVCMRLSRPIRRKRRPFVSGCWKLVGSSRSRWLEPIRGHALRLLDSAS
eukprot:TRINITY_DN101230_c0_g1_i1.p1 TRINITY_DN101230_c0_g1~~TRINITY_DN101230_c0_g1_i1.p1  ORF type:complete len:337 (+),score=20.70 TRINITY_DN101230_c0_g1_i1:65-1075(+)